MWNYLNMGVDGVIKFVIVRGGVVGGISVGVMI